MKNITFLLIQNLEGASCIGRYFPLAKELVKKKFKVTILTLHHNFKELKKKDRIFIKGGVLVKYVGQMQVLKKGDKKIYFKFPKLFFVLIGSFFSLLFSAISTKTDIIFLGKPQPVNGSVAYIIKKLKRKPLIIDCDDYEAESNKFSSKIQQRIFRFFEDNLVCHADIVTNATKFLEERNKSLVNSKVKLVYLPSGIDETNFMDIDEKRIENIKEGLGIGNKKIISYIGGVALKSGHAVDVLIDSFAILRKERKDVRLLIVGGGADLVKMKEYAQEKGISKDVVFVGRIEHSEVKNYISLSDVTVDPVTNTLASKAKSSIKNVESMALGVPTVTMNLGERKCVLDNGNAGMLVEFGAENLALGINKILTDSNFTSKIKNYSKEHIKKYYWKNLVEIFIESLNKSNYL